MLAFFYRITITSCYFVNTTNISRTPTFLWNLHNSFIPTGYSSNYDNLNIPPLPPKNLCWIYFHDEQSKIHMFFICPYNTPLIFFFFLFKLDKSKIKWQVYEVLLKQCQNKKTELQNVKKYVGTFELNIPLLHNVTDIV